MKPDEIEALSFKLIDREAGDHPFSPDSWSVVRRMIHTSADFEYIRSVRFHRNALACGIEALRKGATIITDTEMVKAGIRKRDLDRLGGQVKCFINDPKIGRVALKNNTTKAQAAVDAAAGDVKGGIYVIGNAPTALFRLIELVTTKQARPALIIGFPVGFVNAAESKAALTKLDFPYISNQGRKGGSNVAAAVVNALLKLTVSHDQHKPV